MLSYTVVENGGFRIWSLLFTEMRLHQLFLHKIAGLLLWYVYPEANVTHLQPNRWKSSFRMELGLVGGGRQLLAESPDCLFSVKDNLLFELISRKTCSVTCLFNLSHTWVGSCWNPRWGPPGWFAVSFAVSLQVLEPALPRGGEEAALEKQAALGLLLLLPTYCC